MRRLLFLTMLLFVSTAICQAAKRPKIVKITVEPKEAAIYINNTLEEFYKLKYCSTVVYMVPRA